MQGARLMAAVDREEARRAFAEGCSIADSLQGLAMRLVPGEAVKLGAFVDPPAAVAIFRQWRSRPNVQRHHVGQQLVETLAKAGHFELAVELLEDMSCPVGAGSWVVRLCPDAALRDRAFAAAQERWRLKPRPWNRMDEREFQALFAYRGRQPEPKRENGKGFIGLWVGAPALGRALQGDESAIPDLIADAQKTFLLDRDPYRPNNAPAPFWPSCRKYEIAMYFAGRLQGMHAAPLLAQIPDTDLELFGSIQLAAGALGLDRYSAVFCAGPHP